MIAEVCRVTERPAVKRLSPSGNTKGGWASNEREPLYTHFREGMLK